MSTSSKQSLKGTVFPKGQIVIPVDLRKKYHIEIGDHVDVIPKADGILLKPLPKKKRSLSRTDSLFGVFAKYAKGKPRLKKSDIERATEAGFIKDLEK